MTGGVTVPLLVLLSALAVFANEHPAALAVQDTWRAAGSGSPEAFLHSMNQATSEGVLRFCSEFLDILRARSGTELMLLFAAMRLEATPGEVVNWDDRAVLDMLLSAPDHAYFFENSILVIDSTLACSDSASVHFTINDPYGHSNSFHLQAVNTAGGWRTAGLDKLLESLVGEHLGP